MASLTIKLQVDPQTKKKNVIRPLLIHSCRLSETLASPTSMVRWVAKTDS